MSKSNLSLLFLSFLLITIVLPNCKKAAFTYAIEEEKMVKLLTDIHISEAAAEQVEITIRDSVRKTYYDQVFDIQEISKEAFEQDMKHLRKDPKQLGKIYNEVIKLLQEKKDSLGK